MKKLVSKLLYIFNRQEKCQIAAIFLLMLLGAGLETLGIGLIPPFVALLGNPAIIEQQQTLVWLYTQIKANSHQMFLLWVSVALLSIYLLKNIYLAILTYWQYYFLYEKQVSLSSRLLRSYLNSPYTFHLQRNSADLVRNVTAEIPLIFSGVLVPILILITEIMVMICISLLLAISEPVSSAIASIFLGISIFILNRTISKQMGGQGLIRQEQSGQMIQWVNQSLGGIKEIKLLGREIFFLNAFAKSTQAFCKANLFVGLATQLPNLLIDTVLISAVLLIVIFSLIQGRVIQSILPMLSLFAIAALRLMPSAKRIVSTITNIRYFQYTVDLIYQDLVSLEKIENLQISLNQSQIKLEKSIELQNVQYQYPNSSQQSIMGISLIINKGELVAFIGSSGAGKTTIIDIILGLIIPSQGQILVDGKNILNNLANWQQQIGYIPQSIYLSDDTIRSNIAFGLTTDEIKEEQVLAAVKASQLEELVYNLPDKLDTLVGERGIRLSGGQRQRIGIARALYHNPEVIVMDEATAALDNTTEREFMNALESMSGQKTMIMIAHRLSTVKSCDRLYFMKNGTVEDVGTYNELLSRNREFQTMAQ